MKSYPIRETDSIGERLLKTLDIAARWGYGLPEDELSTLMYGGSVPRVEVVSALDRIRGLSREDGFATIAGHEGLLPKSIGRRKTNGVLAESYGAVAHAFARDLLRHCPFVHAIALSGSTASGGLGAGDDVDFNLFVEDGTKYIVYLAALLVGVKYSITYGHRFAGSKSVLPLLPKVTCVNVLWTRTDCHPFTRTDEFLAYELLRSVPIAGAAYFAEVVASNPALVRHFPQLGSVSREDQVAWPPPSKLSHLQTWLARSRRFREVLERAARVATYSVYRLVQFSRRRDPESTARHEFLRRVKWPYEVFQD